MEARQLFMRWLAANCHSSSDLFFTFSVCVVTRLSAGFTTSLLGRHRFRGLMILCSYGHTLGEKGPLEGAGNHLRGGSWRCSLHPLPRDGCLHRTSRQSSQDRANPVKLIPRSRHRPSLTF